MKTEFKKIDTDKNEIEQGILKQVWYRSILSHFKVKEIRLPTDAAVKSENDSAEINNPVYLSRQSYISVHDLMILRSNFSFNS